MSIDTGCYTVVKLKKSFSYDGAKLWNSLPADVRNSDTLTIFKERTRAHAV